MVSTGHVALAVAWAMVLGASVIGGSALGAKGDSIENLKCPSNDLVYSVVSDFPQMEAGANDSGATTSDQAVDDFLTEYYPKIKQDFQKVKTEKGTTIHQKMKDSSAVAQAEVVSVGGSFEVGRFTACNSLLVGGDQ